jgi:hypothetical protein
VKPLLAKCPGLLLGMLTVAEWEASEIYLSGFDVLQDNFDA